LSYFSVGQIRGSSHLAQWPRNQWNRLFSETCFSYFERTDKKHQHAQQINVVDIL